jgi:hypothetical protein
MSHLIIAKGERQGDDFTIGAAGMRVGRAQSNDLVIDSGTLSQFHCRFFFKSDGSLWVTDFGSTNQTLVNGQPVSEQRLERGDLVDVGGVVFKVVDDRGAAAAPADGNAAPPREDNPPPAHTPAPGQAHYDLGFKRASTPRAKSLVLRLAWAVATLLLIVALAMLAIFFTSSEEGAPRSAAAVVADLPLEIAYEKVEADNSNIFRYALRLEENLLSIRIDDIKNTRHIVREKEVEPGLVADLRERIDDSNFFYLQPDYAGISPGIYELWDLTVTIGAKTSHTRVFNRLEPADFKEVREMVEEFGKTELGLAALALSPEKLREMASDAYLQGRKLFEEREVRYENLYESIRQFKLAQWYLETIEPKPDFYTQAVTGLEDSERALNERYQDYLFRADRAVKLGDWQVAADNLKIILRLVPDRNDERHEDAQKQLLSVERRLR